MNRLLHKYGKIHGLLLRTVMQAVEGRARVGRNRQNSLCSLREGSGVGAYERIRDKSCVMCFCMLCCKSATRSAGHMAGGGRCQRQRYQGRVSRVRGRDALLFAAKAKRRSSCGSSWCGHRIIQRQS